MSIFWPQAAGQASLTSEKPTEAATYLERGCHVLSSAAGVPPDTRALAYERREEFYVRRSDQQELATLRAAHKL